jgi:hypothetical protein
MTSLIFLYSFIFSFISIGLNFSVRYRDAAVQIPSALIYLNISRYEFSISSRPQGFAIKNVLKLTNLVTEEEFEQTFTISV